jgi:predicted RNA methylase
MLADYVRTEKYRDAVMKNPTDFKDKVILDVGCGSGILSLFAAQAGAKKVYAVEASNMAKSAQKLVIANGFQNVIKVI